MNPTQTHKVFGQGVRGMLAVAIAASAVSTATVKAGPTEDTIAAAMNATGIVSGVTGKTVKQKDQTWTPPSDFNKAMIASFAITFSNPNIASVASKLTASKLFSFYQKGLPEYSPNLAQLAVAAALKEVNNPLKYKDVNAKAKDAAKIGSLAIKNGMKAYKSGTRNSGWTGFTSQTAAVIEANIANIAYQTNAALVGASDATKVAVIANMTKSLVKATSKFKKFTTFGSSAAVVGFIGQVGAVLNPVNTETTAVIQNAVKNDKKNFLQITEAAAYAAYAVYIQNGGTLDVAAWVALNKGDIFAAVKNGYGKKADDFLAQIETAITDGATDADAGEIKFGARDLSSAGNPLVINKGDQAPVTKITNS